MPGPQPFTRRAFIRVSAAAGGGLLIAVCAPREDSVPTEGSGVARSGPSLLNAYVEIGLDGRVTITAPCPEIGQGVRTALPMLVAEELGCDWTTVSYEQASANARYGAMTVGGSDSVTDYWAPLRSAGATARELLKESAAQEWGVDRTECIARNGFVSHEPSGRRLGFGELADGAARLGSVAGVSVLDESDFDLIGTRVAGVDAAAIVTGTAQYGIDVRVPGMLFAVVARPPVHGGRVASFDDAAALRVPGVRSVVEVEPLVVAGQLYGAVRGGVAVLAENTWAAMRGRDALRVTWEDGANAEESSAAWSARASALARQPGESILRDDGDVDGSLAGAARTIEAEYQLPALAHTCMEPVNFTADVQADRCEVWGPTQTPRTLHSALGAALALPASAVQVHPTLAGGGFGRRLAYDYGVEAAMISRAAGAPVKVVWTREDDVRFDYYRTPSYHRLRAGIDADGAVTAWHHHLLTASLARHSELSSNDPAALYDVQGAADMPYTIPNLRFEYTHADFGLQMGSWRSVAHSFNVFVVNSFIDEIAASAGLDPLDLQLRLLGSDRVLELSLPLPGRRGGPRPDIGLLRSVLELAADRASWGTPAPAGSGRGIACCYYKNTYAAHVAEVSVSPAGVPRVRRVVAAVDCGRVVNPSGAEAQVEGAVMDGVATVLKWGITVADGRVEQSNLHDYEPLRIDEAPTVEVHLVPSDRAPSGLGEPPYPSVAPAITNAIFAATGRRWRRLPVT